MIILNYFDKKLNFERALKSQKNIPLRYVEVLVLKYNNE